MRDCKVEKIGKKKEEEEEEGILRILEATLEMVLWIGET